MSPGHPTKSTSAAVPHDFDNRKRPKKRLPPFRTRQGVVRGRLEDALRLTLFLILKRKGRRMGLTNDFRPFIALEAVSPRIPSLDLSSWTDRIV